MKRIIKYSDFVNETNTARLGDLFQSHTYALKAAQLVHGTPLSGLYGMLKDGVYGVSHGELDEDTTFSTSLNHKMLSMFSERRDPCGFIFRLEQETPLFVIKDWFHALHDTKSGLSHEVEPDTTLEMCDLYGISTQTSYGVSCLGQNFLERNLPEHFLGAVYEYTTRLSAGNMRNDEAEVIIIGQRNIDRLFDTVPYEVVVDGEVFDNREDAIAYIEETYDADELGEEY
jgi:hypothetical protein